MDEQGKIDLKYAFKWSDDESAYLSESKLECGVDNSIFSHKNSINLKMTCTLPKWRPFYEAQFGVEIFVDLCNCTLSSPVSNPTCCQDTFPLTS